MASKLPWTHYHTDAYGSTRAFERGTCPCCGGAVREADSVRVMEPHAKLNRMGLVKAQWLPPEIVPTDAYPGGYICALCVAELPLRNRKPREQLTKLQRNVLGCLEKYGYWHPGCGWVWDNRSNTERVLKALIKHGWVKKEKPQSGWTRYVPVIKHEEVNDA